MKIPKAVFFVMACSAHAASFSSVVGYTVAAATTARGTFNGADYGKLIELENGWVFEFREYGYSYAYRPDVVVFQNGTDYKLLIERELYNATIKSGAPISSVGIPGGYVPGGTASLLDLIARGGVHGVAQNNAQQASNQPGPAPERETASEMAGRLSSDGIQRARERHSDFDAVIGSRDFIPTGGMQKEIRLSSSGGELAYWLATHLEDYRRIAVLPPDAERRELRRIEAAIK